MTRFSTWLWMLALIVAAFMLYSVKYQVQSVKNQVAATARELEAEREAMHVADAEWAYLNRPERLQALAAKYLTSTDITVDHVADIQMIPFPEQTVASLSLDDSIRPASMSMEKKR